MLSAWLIVGGALLVDDVCLVIRGGVGVWYKVAREHIEIARPNSDNCRAS